MRAVGVLGLLSPLVVAAVIACGSSENEASSEDPGGATPQDPNAPRAPDASAPRGPVVRRAFPLALPSIGGYALAPAFPGATIRSPIALVWPKVAGAPPFVLTRDGSIERVIGGASRSVLDFSSSVAAVSESGALGMALHPRFGDGTGPSPYAYVWYNTPGSPNNRQRLARFTWNAASASFDRGSELVMLEEEEIAPEHNAGHMEFGPDGFLYFGNGDDSNAANHQRLDRALFAGIFRIDVDMQGGAVSHPPPRGPEGGYSSGYFIPNDNPFVGVANANEEFFALGLRNPFGFSFDRATGQLWVADVGDTWREEVNLVTKGGNYGWPVMEGTILRKPGAATVGAVTSPRYSFSHAEMGDLTSVLGGYVYRGKELPELVGTYVFSDWPSSRVWALDVKASTPKRRTLIDDRPTPFPMALAQDNDGEIYMLALEGVTKLVRAPNRDAVPKHLTETLLFRDVPSLVPEDALVPYTISSPLWSDGAAKQRWIVLPPGTKVEVDDAGGLELPKGTVLVKHFELPASAAPKGRTRKLETRVLVVGDEATYGVTYRWNPEGTDAELVTEPTQETIEDTAGAPKRTWHFPSFGECWSCHRAENRVLGFTARQLRVTNEAGVAQLDTLTERGVFAPESIAKMPEALTRPSDTSASLEERAMAYLAANCSGCHHEGASYLGGEQTWQAEPGIALANRGLVGAPHHNAPTATALGIANAPLVDPGNPKGSLLVARIASNDPDLRMPPLARNVVDRDGLELLEAWVRSLAP